MKTIQKEKQLCFMIFMYFLIVFVQNNTYDESKDNSDKVDERPGRCYCGCNFRNFILFSKHINEEESLEELEKLAISNQQTKEEKNKNSQKNKHNSNTNFIFY